MSRNRLPVDKAKLTGKHLVHPERHGNRTKPKTTRAVGDPYSKMDEAQQAQWFEFVRDLPWLNSSHRVLLRIACRLTVDLDGDEFGVSKAQALSSILSKLGATPVDESKVSMAPSEETNEFFDN